MIATRAGYMLILGLTVLFLLTLGCTKSPDNSLERIIQTGRIRMALSVPYPPFSCYSATNELNGFDVELARELALQLKIDPEIVVRDWPGIIEGLLNHDYDIILGSMAVTPERLSQVDFTLPYYRSSVQVMVRKESSIRRLADVAGKTVGLGAGSNYEADAKKLGAGDIRFYPVGFKAIEDIRNGRIDATIIDRVVGIYAKNQTAFPLAFLDPPLRQETVAIALRKNEPALLKRLNGLLEGMQKDGTLDRLIKKVAQGQYECRESK